MVVLGQQRREARQERVGGFLRGLGRALVGWLVWGNTGFLWVGKHWTDKIRGSLIEGGEKCHSSAASLWTDWCFWPALDEYWELFL